MPIYKMYTIGQTYSSNTNLILSAIRSPCSPDYFDIFISYFHIIFSFYRKTHLRCISSVLLYYNRKYNANILDVCHRLILLVYAKECLGRIYILDVCQGQIYSRLIPKIVWAEFILCSCVLVVLQQ